MFSVENKYRNGNLPCCDVVELFVVLIFLSLAVESDVNLDLKWSVEILRTEPAFVLNKTNRQQVESTGVLHIRPTENFQVSKAQTPLICFGPKREYKPKFRPFGSPLGVPPGDGKFCIFKLKI